jgi:hypothetical protein
VLREDERRGRLSREGAVAGSSLGRCKPLIGCRGGRERLPAHHYAGGLVLGRGIHPGISDWSEAAPWTGAGLASGVLAAVFALLLGAGLAVALAAGAGVVGLASGLVFELAVLRYRNAR